ncbi:MAG: hypothetical protein K8H75_01055 [Sulfuricella sp.]|nr:hypothetical protein [Sulfuricella sp.]
MSNKHSLLKAFSTIGLILTLGVSMSADAGLFGFGGDRWKEEVLLHDGSKIIVERSFSRGGRHEPGQESSIKEQDINFTLPGTHQSILWKSEYSEDVGRANFNLLALHILNGTPYVVASPNLCLSYNKWGRPNPPYVFFKYDGKVWQRIPLAEFPAEFKEMNVVITVDDAALFREIDKHEVVSVATIRELNGQLTQPEYKTILREAMKTEWCPQYPSGPKAPLPMTPISPPNSTGVKK